MWCGNKLGDSCIHSKLPYIYVKFNESGVGGLVSVRLVDSQSTCQEVQILVRDTRPGSREEGRSPPSRERWRNNTRGASCRGRSRLVPLSRGESVGDASHANGAAAPTRGPGFAGSWRSRRHHRSPRFLPPEQGVEDALVTRLSHSLGMRSVY